MRGAGGYYAWLWYYQRKFNIIKRRAVYYQNVNSLFPYNVPFSGFKSAINIRQMYFMNPMKPTSRWERISYYGRTSFPSLYKFKFSLDTIHIQYLSIPLHTISLSFKPFRGTACIIIFISKDILIMCKVLVIISGTYVYITMRRLAYPL